MDPDTILRVGREALILVLLLSAAPVLCALITGLIVAVLQTVTSIQEQTLTVAPKIAAVLLTIVLLGGWLVRQLATFATVLFEAIPTVR